MSTESAYQFDLSGGSLSLDFVNTVSRRSIPQRRVDHVTHYQDLLVFANQSKLISQGELKQLRANAQSDPSQAGRTLDEALELREALYRIFTALANGKGPQAEDIELVNEQALLALAHRHLERAKGAYRWNWQTSRDSRLQSIVWPIAQSAADLLTSEQLKHIRQCEASDCDWLFLDNSRNGSRRWCDMKVCGNREKARRHYRRAHDGRKA